MRTAWIMAAAGLMVGVLGAMLWRQGDVQAQPPAAKTSYEYKVVEFGTGPLNTETADDMTQKLNKLAADGWEYVGPVANATADKAFLQGYVAFRRAKK
jgi:hypothetical protein